jgi:hypothetical protein
MKSNMINPDYFHQAGEALHALVEELYDSRESIVEDRVNNSIKFLCQALIGEDYFKFTDEDLKVAHRKDLIPNPIYDQVHAMMKAGL